MDDSGTNALAGAVQAIQQLLFGEQTAPAAENPIGAPGAGREIEGTTDVSQLPAGYVTDSAADVKSRLTKRRAPASGHPKVPDARLLRSAGAEMQWEDLVGPPVITRLPASGDPAPITAHARVTKPHGSPPQGGRGRGEEKDKGRAAPAREVIRSGSEREPNGVASPVQVHEHEQSSTKSSIDMDREAMEQLTGSMRRMRLNSPRMSPSGVGNVVLQPPPLNLDEVGSEAQKQSQSLPPSRVHGEVGHDGENDREAEDSREKKKAPAPSVKEELKGALKKGTDQVMQWHERNWDHVCQIEASADLFGVPAERVWFCSRICGFAPGDREGLTVGLCPSRGETAYLVALDTAEKAILHVLGPFSKYFETKVREGGVAEAKRLREQWSALLNELIAETRPGQLGELYRRTERVFQEVEEAVLPGFKAYRPSLDEAVESSTTDLDERAASGHVRGLKKRREQRERRARPTTPPPARESSRGGGPQYKPAATSGREENLPPKGDDRRDRASGTESEATRWRKRENEMFARLEGLIVASQQTRAGDLNGRDASIEGEMVGVGARPKTRKGEEAAPHRRDTSTPQSITMATRLEPGAIVNPVVRRYMDSPFVSAAAEYEEEAKLAEARRAAAREKAAAKRRAKRRGYVLDSSSSADEEEELKVPTTVRFRDRIKNFPKFNKPDGVQTWPDFLQQLVELLRLYQIPAREWPAWLIDRLAGKAQAALLNLTSDQRGNWAELVSALNSHFHVEFEMRSAEEELLSRKQGPKESVREFIAQLRFLARKAYGQDLEKREAAMIKRLELGLASASLRRTFDDMYGQPGITFAVLTGELIRRESRDEPARYQQFITQEKVDENAKKPNNPSIAAQAKQIVKEVLLAQQGAVAEGQQAKGNAGAAASQKRGASRNGGARGRGRGRGQRRGGATRAEPGKGGGSDKIVCWNCDQQGHYRTDCPTATPDQKKEWQKAAENAKRVRAQRPAKEQGQANVASAGDGPDDTIAEEGAPDSAAAQEELLAAGHESEN